VKSLPLPTGAKSAVVVVPAIRAFNYPASRPATRAPDEGRLASSADVRNDTSLASFLLAVPVVISLVQAEIRWPARAAWPLHKNRIESRAHHPLVVHVRARERDGNGHTSPIGQNVTFDAAFSAIGGVRTREVPPFDAFTMAPSSEAHSQSIPRSTW
jgi:hypothetical protein